jgi:hypothetical protein
VIDGTSRCLPPVGHRARWIAWGISLQVVAVGDPRCRRPRPCQQGGRRRADQSLHRSSCLARGVAQRTRLGAHRARRRGVRRRQRAAGSAVRAPAIDAPCRGAAGGDGRGAGARRGRVGVRSADRPGARRWGRRPGVAERELVERRLAGPAASGRSRRRLTLDTGWIASRAAWGERAPSRLRQPRSRVSVAHGDPCGIAGERRTTSRAAGCCCVHHDADHHGTRCRTRAAAVLHFWGADDSPAIHRD